MINIYISSHIFKGQRIVNNKSLFNFVLMGKAYRFYKIIFMTHILGFAYYSMEI